MTRYRWARRRVRRSILGVAPIELTDVHMEPECLAHWRRQWPRVAYLQSSNGNVPGREAFVFEDGSLHVVCLLTETAAVFLTAAPDEWERPHKPDEPNHPDLGSGTTRARRPFPLRT